ncbi:MAG: methyltransferase domain-containing protein [Lachnospiraceae bacterium]|nr:methyltransferase domain-containing protein [Lachnospiraceae bacterium]
MFKYDFSLDMYTDNANADIIRRIENGSRVLEFGPANGRMTKFLKEQKQCLVDIVEIDEESGKCAAEYANKACLGVEDGDINRTRWQEILEGNIYDVIVFTDVLEHLSNPMDVLKRCSTFLGDNGKILCSIPNIAHASVILGLINGKFEYTDNGLLDRTHIHFFTEESFKRLINDAGYCVSYEHSILGKVGTIELPYTYETVGKDVQRVLKNRVNNEAYQYIFELKKDIYQDEVENVFNLIPGQVGILKCYIKEEDDSDFCEQKCISKRLYSQNVNLELDISGYSNVIALRVQLLDTNGVIRINYVGYTSNGEKGSVKYTTNGSTIYNNTICSLEEPVNIYWWLDKEAVSNTIVKLSYDIIVYNSDVLRQMGGFTRILEEMRHEIGVLECNKEELKQQLDISKEDNESIRIDIQNLEDELENLQTVNKEIEGELGSLQVINESIQLEKEKKIQDLKEAEEVLQKRYEENELLKKQIEAIDEDRVRLYHMIEDLNGLILHRENTISWRLTWPLRKIGAILSKLKKLIKGLVKLSLEALRYSKKHGIKAAVNRTIHYKQIKKEKEQKKQEIIIESQKHEIWDELDKWIDNTPHDFIDVFPAPMGWNTPLFQRFQHLSLQAGNAGGISFYGAHPVVDTDVDTYKFVNETLCIVNMECQEVVDRFWNVLDKKSGLKYLRIQSIDLATTIERIEDFIRRGYKIVYEYIDEITPQITGNIPEFVFKRHEYLLKNEKITVVATSDKLFDQVKPYRENNMIMLNNGVDYDHWNIQRENIECPEDIKDIIALGKIVVGYHGALAQWIDYELLKRIAQDKRFVLLLIGFEHDGNLKKSGILDYDNVYYLGAKNYQELNTYCSFYDIAILPFVINNITLSVSPVKIFEYMAAGKPVVTYALPECKKYASCLCADSQEEFLDKLEMAVSLRKDKKYLELLRQDALNNTWTAIMQKMIEYVKKNYEGESEDDILNTGIGSKERNSYLNQILNQPNYIDKRFYREITDKPYARCAGDSKIIAYYLTQFHPDRHNEEWWGKGVTEWNNVTRAVPQFSEHYQPRLPGELGFYDLRIIDNMRRQIELARMYGIYGFSFYYYWFDGERLLEKPLEMFLENKDLDFPFSICWANENWTKRYDGTNTDILMEQRNSVDSYCNVIKDIVRFLSDSRYITIDNRKMLTVYRPSLMPKVKSVLSYWRDHCRDNGIGEIYIIAVKENGVETDWLAEGYDAVTEFHPGTLYTNCVNVSSDLKYVRNDFAGEVFSYPDIVYKQKYFMYDYNKLYRAVMPMWDNTARRNNKGMIFHGSTPALYKQWLKDVINAGKRRDDIEENLIFINAWNEWGEGAYLEPDKRYGYAYLQATKEAVEESRCI